MRPSSSSSAAGSYTAHGSARQHISAACLKCKARKSKCSGDYPCRACSRSGLECVYDVTLDKRRKIHLERAHTESALQKELLTRLFDLVRGSDRDLRNKLKDDIHIQNLSRRLGFRALTDTGDRVDQHEEIRSWPSSQSWEASPEASVDLIQSEELIRRHRLSPLEYERTTADRNLPTIMGFEGNASMGQLDLAALSRESTPSQIDFDPRDQYRIFCSKHHDIPAFKSIAIFGQPSANLAQQLHLDPAHLHLDLHVPEYLIQPALFEEERCPLAAVYTDFRDYGRRRLAEGHSAEVVLGSPRVELAVFFGGRKSEDPHTPNTWACQYMRLLRDMDIYVSLACVFTYSRFMRWAIAPSEETYALLPEAMRPTPLQRLIPHHPGVDLPIFPEMRDGLIHDMRDYIVALQTFGCSVNWPYGLEGAIEVRQGTGLMTVTDAFAAHVSNLHNWSISEKFAGIFPELRGFYRVEKLDTIPVSEVQVDAFFRQHGIEHLLTPFSVV
ncbi:hypothetical protein PV08_10827 [Exophiala spinifera]|uniref:Zn(2)-C6 fungal-type domain-containing protein n=1 Tax=Exophiala spinifera TaxID=91928 RepID=A0A0D1Y994_9EURO|nr:uncharacterized protein PV08_10827 [Exophiala spinifera]KIW11526.1 hypothetical protein PV08_10827 [Exophiala spinifera]